MNLIPDKNLYIVTSALKPIMGVWNNEQRFKQTIETILSIRNRDPKSIIVLADCSVHTVTKEEKDVLSGICDLVLDLSNNSDVKNASINRMKSLSENALLFHTLHFLKNQQFIKSCKRIFKISARSILEDDYDAEEHNIFGKFVFKKRIPTWMNQVVYGANHLLITRFFSMCPSLIDTYLQVIQKNIELLQVIDTEHAHFINIPQNYLVELDKLHCWGWLAEGPVEYY